ncbi:MAG TPA: LysM peptidoglycan-binding domain-containing protein, partial [Gaiella sp.]|nr:LysM peptidoglycan-binding domain-containing protein [Gaiella sp.]
SRGLTADGIAGPRTFRALARGKQPVRRAPRTTRRTPTIHVFHVVQPGEGFAVIAQRYGVSPVKLANTNGLRLASVIVPGQRLRVPGRLLRPAKTITAPRLPAGTHRVSPGESFFSIAQRYHISPWRLARTNRLSLMATISPGQRLRLPAGARVAPRQGDGAVDRATVRAAIDRWSRVYGVDPNLARALAWMESGFQQDVVSSAGAIGVMQLLPETWEWVDTLLLREVTPRNYDGNIRAGVRYLRWQLDQFGGDVKLALAGYYQGARAVRERGLFDDTKQYVSVILQLYGSV